MNVQCPKCKSRHQVSAPVPSGGMSFVCPGCEHVFHVAPETTKTRLPAPGQRLYLRRASGKVLGPFPVRVIQQMIRSGQVTDAAAVSTDKVEFIGVGEHPELREVLSQKFSGKSARTTGDGSSSTLTDKDQTAAGFPVSSMRELNPAAAAALGGGPRPQVADLSLDEAKIADDLDDAGLDWSFDDDFDLNLDESVGLPVSKSGSLSFGASRPRPARATPPPPSASDDDDGDEDVLRPRSMFDLPAIQKSGPPSLGKGAAPRTSDETMLPTARGGGGKQKNPFAGGRPTARYEATRAEDLPAEARGGQLPSPTTATGLPATRAEDLPSTRGGDLPSTRAGDLPSSRGASDQLPSATRGDGLPSSQAPRLPSPTSRASLPAGRDGDRTPLPSARAGDQLPARGFGSPTASRPATRKVQRPESDSLGGDPTPSPAERGHGPLPMMDANELPFLGSGGDSDIAPATDDDVLSLGGRGAGTPAGSTADSGGIPLMGRDELPFYDDEPGGGDDLLMGSGHDDDLLLGGDDLLDDDPLGLSSPARSTGGGGLDDDLLLGNDLDDDPLGLGGSSDPLGLDEVGDDPLGLDLDDGGIPLLDDDLELDVPPASGGPSLAAPDSSRSSTYGSYDERDQEDDDAVELELEDHSAATATPASGDGAPTTTPTRPPRDKKKKSTSSSGAGKAPAHVDADGGGGSRVKVLLVALVVVGLVVVGLGFTDYGPFKFGGGDEVAQQAQGQPPTPDTTTQVPSELSAEELARDRFQTYTFFDEKTQALLDGAPDSVQLHGQALAARALMRVRYPDTRPDIEDKALGNLSKLKELGASDTWASLGMAAWLAYKADPDGAEKHIQALASDPQMRYFEELLRGVARMQAASAAQGDERIRLATEATEHLNRIQDRAGGAYMLGRTLEIADKPSQARKAYEAAVAADPDHISARLALSRLQLEEGASEEARSSWTPVLQEPLKSQAAPSEMATALFLDGREALNRNDLELAESRFKEALAVSKVHGPSLEGLGDVFARSDRFEEGTAWLEEAYGQKPEQPEALLALARLYLGLTDVAPDPQPMYRRADELIQEGRSRYPNDPRFAFTDGLVKDSQGNASEAESAFKTAIDIEPGYQLARIELARLLAAKGSQEAELLAGELIQEVQQAELDAAEMTALGRFFFESEEQVEEGVRLLEEATERNHGWVPAHEALVEHYVANGRLDEARSHIDALTRLNAMSPRLRYLNARAHFQQQDYAVAAELMRDVVQEAPENAEYQYFLGRVHFARGSFATAQAAFEQATTLDRNHWAARYYIGRSELAQGSEAEGEEAQKHFEQALRIFRDVHEENSGNGEYHYHLAHALQITGRDSEAMKEYKRLLSRAGDPDVPESMFALQSPLPWHGRASLYRARAQRSAAESDLRKALEIDAGFLAARADLARVLYEGGSPASAASELEQLRDKTGGEMDAELYYLLGMSYLALDDPRQIPSAVTALEQARDRGYADTGATGIIGVIDPVDVHRTLGLLYRDQNRRGDAVRELETYLNKSKHVDRSKQREIEKEIRNLR